MSLRVVKTRWVVIPLTSLLLLFSGGAAVAPDCHIESAAQTQPHSAVTHNHSHEAPVNAVSIFQPQNIVAEKSLDFEMCLTVGFFILLLFRFIQQRKITYTVRKISLPRFILPRFRSSQLGYLNLTHLKLGIIRI